MHLKFALQQKTFERNCVMAKSTGRMRKNTKGQRSALSLSNASSMCWCNCCKGYGRQVLVIRKQNNTFFLDFINAYHFINLRNKCGLVFSHTVIKNIVKPSSHVRFLALVSQCIYIYYYMHILLQPDPRLHDATQRKNS